MILRDELATKINLDNGIIKKLKLKEYKNILVLTGPKNSLSVFKKHIEKKLKQKFHLYSNIRTNPSENDIYNIINFARGKKIDLILSVGGGAVMDCGRMVSLLLSHGGLLHEYVEGGTIGTMGITPNLIYHITIPTISGSGGEVSGVANFRRANRFYTISSPFLRPDETYIDPKLMVNIPKQVWANIAFGGFVRALEAYVSSYSTYVSDMFAEESLKAYVSTLQPLLSDTTNLEHINKIVVASLNSLIAHNMSSGGAISAIANSLSANLNIHLGTCLALLTSKVSSLNYEYNKTKYNKILEIFGNKADEKSVSKSKTSVNKVLSDFINDIGVHLPSIKNKLNDLAIDVVATQSMTYKIFGNPKELTKQDIVNLLKNFK